jgi:hypothetical protein
MMGISSIRWECRFALFFPEALVHFRRVNRVSKAILAGLAGLIGAGVVLGIGVRWYFGSAGAHAQMEAALTERLGSEVHFKEIHFSVVGGFGLEGLEVVQGPVRVLEVSRIKADLRWLPLLRKRLWLESVELESPKFRCAQSEKGDWILPVVGKKQASAKSEYAVSSEKPRTGTGSWKLGSVTILNGSAEFKGKKGEVLGNCSGIEYSGNKTVEGFEGQLKIAEFDWLEWGHLEHLVSGFKVAGDRWHLHGLKAGFAGGNLGGNLRVGIAKKGTPFEGDLEVVGSDVGQILSDAGVEGNRLAGRLNGKVQVRGEFSQFKQLTGDGDFSLVEGTLGQMDVLRAIGQVLRVEELERLELSRALTRFHLEKQKVHVQALELDSARVGISGTGSLQFDGKAGFDVLLGIQDTLHKRLPDFVRDSFQEVAAGNRPAVRFKVTGKGGQLKTDLAEKLIGRKVPDQLENLVSGLLGFVRKSEKEEPNRGGDEKESDSKKKKKKSSQSGSSSDSEKSGSKASGKSAEKQAEPKMESRTESVGSEKKGDGLSGPSLDGKVGAENRF